MEHVVRHNRTEPYPRQPFTVRSKNERMEEADKNVDVNPLSSTVLCQMMDIAYDLNTRYEGVDPFTLFDLLVKGGYVRAVEE